MFIDQVKIYVKGGKGGNGCSSLYRDKYSRRGIPDGGNGGRGSDIIIKADRNIYTLLDFHYNRHFFGFKGRHGSGNNKKGKGGLPVVVRAPLGTTVRDIKAGCQLRDLKEDQEEFIVCSGGAGGLGNRRAKVATLGEPGEEKELLLVLKLIADVGVIGFPNAGKSTLVCAVSGAHPKIAAYPFTTLSPVLGVVKKAGRSFVIADIPGLIEGSSCGKGLGDTFLRHIERTKMLIHLIDMSGLDGRDPLEDYKTINKELKNYSREVYEKPQIIAANKMDLGAAASNLARFKKSIKKKAYPISALKREGLEELLDAVSRRV